MPNSLISKRGKVQKTPKGQYVNGKKEIHFSPDQTGFWPQDAINFDQFDKRLYRSFLVLEDASISFFPVSCSKDNFNVVHQNTAKCAQTFLYPTSCTKCVRTSRHPNFHKPQANQGDVCGRSNVCHVGARPRGRTQNPRRSSVPLRAYATGWPPAAFMPVRST